MKLVAAFNVHETPAIIAARDGVGVENETRDDQYQDLPFPEERKVIKPERHQNEDNEVEAVKQYRARLRSLGKGRFLRGLGGHL
jgi:hypothetical protein